jgi:hypothetical protein
MQIVRIGRASVQFGADHAEASLGHPSHRAERQHAPWCTLPSRCEWATALGLAPAGFCMRPERRAARRCATPSVFIPPSGDEERLPKRLQHKPVRKRAIQKDFTEPSGAFGNHHVLEVSLA